MLRTAAILFFAVFLVSTVAKATTIEERITRQGNKTVIEHVEVPTKKLRNEGIIRTVRDTAEKAVDLDWDEGSRSLVRHLTDAPDDLDIKRMKIENGVVIEMDIIANVLIGESNEGHRREYSARCEVFAEKLDRIFEVNYAICVTEDGQEIEYEH